MRGLYQKYIVQKADGSPVDPNAKYIVLRVDAGEYVQACRAAVAVFARRVWCRNPDLAYDLEQLLFQYGSPFKKPDPGPATIRSDWSLPDKTCPTCGVKLQATACDIDGAWALMWECENDCVDDLVIDWPFIEDWANAVDLEAAGFEIA